uniref:Helitron helicase-like domain-containing protein n=1 Tax=Trichogramma kaykai TaxID=54128 RepID=A0ABD2WD00_9HYME
MPLEETLKKICPETLALNPNQEMFIFIRGVPTKTKIVWEDVVNMKTVYTALVWLQSHNKYYKKIRLPLDASALLEEVEQIGVCIQDAVAALIRSEHGDKENKLNAKTQLTPSTSSATLCVNTDMPRLPLVTQKCPNDKFYENVTIYPLHEKKLNEEPAKLFQMLKVHTELLHNKTKGLDCLCFPDLFPTGVDGQRASRFVPLRDAEFIKSKLMLRGTASYWKMPRSNLRKMSDEYGPATFFMTISPGEWMWPDLGKYICEANHWPMGKSIPELIATDPVSTARFFYTKLKAFIKFLTSSEHPIGEVAHYYWVCEYQGRGLPHYHFLIWIKDAPVFGTSSNEEIQRFILQHITCQIPDPRVSPELHRRVQSYQQHKHNIYYMRSKKTKIGFRNACRFGFPRPVTKNLVLRDLGVAIAGRRKLRNKNKFYDLPRTKEEAFTNDYNPIILTIWEGNNDIQLISEKSYLITEYVTKYGT